MNKKSTIAIAAFIGSLYANAQDVGAGNIGALAERIDAKGAPSVEGSTSVDDAIFGMLTQQSQNLEARSYLAGIKTKQAAVLENLASNSLEEIVAKAKAAGYDVEVLEAI